MTESGEEECTAAASGAKYFSTSDPALEQREEEGREDRHSVPEGRGGEDRDISTVEQDGEESDPPGGHEEEESDDDKEVEQRRATEIGGDFYFSTSYLSLEQREEDKHIVPERTEGEDRDTSAVMKDGDISNPPGSHEEGESDEDKEVEQRRAEIASAINTLLAQRWDTRLDTNDVLDRKEDVPTVGHGAGDICGSMDDENKQTGEKVFPLLKIVVQGQNNWESVSNSIQELLSAQGTGNVSMGKKNDLLLAFHLAIESGAPIEVVKQIVNAGYATWPSRNDMSGRQEDVMREESPSTVNRPVSTVNRENQDDSKSFPLFKTTTQGQKGWKSVPRKIQSHMLTPSIDKKDISLALQWAIKFDAPKEVIENIIPEFGLSSESTFCSDMTPSARTRDEITSGCGDRQQDSILKKDDNDGQLPLHNTLRRESRSMRVFEFLLKEDMTSAEVADKTGKLPLHHACFHKVPSKVVEKLLKANKYKHGGADTKDNFGDLPIHIAYRRYTTCNEDLLEPGSNSFKVLELLLDKFPKGSCVEDKHGTSILHDACRNGQSELVKCIVDKYEKGVLAFDNTGNLPLHILCQNILCGILEKYPEQKLKVQENYGFVPHHNATPDVVKTLVDKNANGLILRDHDGKIPIQIFSDLPKGILKQPEEATIIMELLEILEVGHTKVQIENKQETMGKVVEFLFELNTSQKETLCSKPTVQYILNKRILSLLPTFMLMGDLYFQVLVAFSYGAMTRTYTSSQHYVVKPWMSNCVYVGLAWFIFREIFQLASFKKVFPRSYRFKYFSDVWNLLDVVYVICILYATITMRFGEGKSFRERQDQGSMLSWTFLFILTKVTSYMRAIQMPFALLVGMMVDVAKNLIAFLGFFCLSMLAFAQINYIAPPSGVYYDPDVCKEDTFGSSLWNIFIAILGDFECIKLSHAMFALFSFLNTIMFLNVLIAIVTNTYDEATEKGRDIFWRNRLYFLQEMHIYSSYWREVQCFKCCNKNVDKFSDKLEQIWRDYIEYYYTDQGRTKTNFLLSMRIMGLFWVLPWLCAGLVTFGLLWPPQVKEHLLYLKGTVDGNNGKHCCCCSEKGAPG